MGWLSPRGPANKLFKPSGARFLARYSMISSPLKEQERILTQQESQLGESRDQEQRLLRKVDTLSKKLEEPVAEVQSLKASLVSGPQSCCLSKAATSLSQPSEEPFTWRISSRDDSTQNEIVQRSHDMIRPGMSGPKSW